MKFVLSEKHPWQDDENVQQILVFTDIEVMELFISKFEKLKETIHIEEIDENFLGAVYKLRAVKANDGLWLSIIKCGFTGKELWCGFGKYASDDGALTSARHQLKTEIYKAIDLF